MTAQDKRDKSRETDKAAARRARLGVALRANLVKRKAQAKARPKTATSEDEDVRSG
jgi:hypothetical protein